MSVFEGALVQRQHIGNGMVPFHPITLSLSLKPPSPLNLVKNPAGVGVGGGQYLKMLFFTTSKYWEWHGLTTSPCHCQNPISVKTFKPYKIPYQEARPLDDFVRLELLSLNKTERRGPHESTFGLGIK